MRKLRVFESISADGYFTDANGDMSWAHAGRKDPELRQPLRVIDQRAFANGNIAVTYAV